jgi:GT2 family glycosyltransferase
MNSTLNLPLVSIIIPNYNGALYLDKCLRSLQVQTYRKFEIVIVDNASQDESITIAQAAVPEARLIIQKHNTGFAGGVNAGIKASRGEWVAVINNDTELAPDWLAECIAMIQKQPEAAFLACRILEFTGRERLFSAGDCFLRAGIGYRRGQEQTDREDFHRECEIFSTSGCAALYRKEIIEELSGFDERFFAYLEDVDLGLRLQAANYKGFYTPRAVVFHHGGATSGGEFSRLSVRLRTRNSLLLLIKSLPVPILLRCLPMIFLSQLAWFLRAAVHKRLGSYLHGLAEAFVLAPAMMRDHIKATCSTEQLWRRILDSEQMAYHDLLQSPEEVHSLFLKWYFRLFTSVRSNDQS